MDGNAPDADNQSMFAGSICEETDCTGLVLLLLAMALGAVLVAVVTIVAWAMTVSAVLQRRGWQPVTRRVTAGVYCAIGLPAVLGGLHRLPISGGIGWALVVVPAVPMAIWQRHVTRRHSAEV
jgi:hypothetical protein